MSASGSRGNCAPRTPWVLSAATTLKRVYQRLTDRYLTNGEFKGAMLDAGYRPIDRTEPSWQFGYGLADSHILDKSRKAQAERRGRPDDRNGERQQRSEPHGGHGQRVPASRLRRP